MGCHRPTREIVCLVYRKNPPDSHFRARVLLHQSLDAVARLGVPSSTRDKVHENDPRRIIKRPAGTDVAVAVAVGRNKRSAVPASVGATPHGTPVRELREMPALPELPELPELRYACSGLLYDRNALDEVGMLYSARQVGYPDERCMAGARSTEMESVPDGRIAARLSALGVFLLRAAGCP